MLMSQFSRQSYDMVVQARCDEVSYLAYWRTEQVDIHTYNGHNS